jgi:ADP-ribose pyrophosphatase
MQKEDVSGNVQPWTELSSAPMPSGKYRRVIDVTFELPSGKREVFTVKDEGEVVCVLAVTTDRNVILARQFRPGPKRVLDELPGGGKEPGETSAQAIARELLEETGYEPGQLISVGFPIACAYSNMKREAFLALDCVQVAAPNPDSTEFIQPILKSLDDFVLQLQRGDCSDVAAGWMGLFKMGVLSFSAPVKN